MTEVDVFTDPAVEMAGEALGCAADAVTAQLAAASAAAGGDGENPVDPVVAATAGLRFMVARWRGAAMPDDQIETLASAAMARFIADRADSMRAVAEATVLPGLSEELDAAERDTVWLHTLSGVWTDVSGRVEAVLAQPHVEPHDRAGVAGRVVHLAAAAADASAAAAHAASDPNSPLGQAAASAAGDVESIEAQWRQDACRLLPTEPGLLPAVSGSAGHDQVLLSALLAFDAAIHACVASRMTAAAAAAVIAHREAVLNAGDVLHCCRRSWRWLTLLLVRAPQPAACQAVAAAADSWHRTLADTAAAAAAAVPGTAASVRAAAGGIGIQVMSILAAEFAVPQPQPSP